MAVQFDNQPVPVARVSCLSADVFQRRYRNKEPVILQNVISGWRPLAVWTNDYLQRALEHEYHKDLRVFVSHDNRLFINHPSVTELITMKPGEFLQTVFGGCDCKNQATCKSSVLEKKRLYLRTFSMPEVLFYDIDIPEQVKSLLDVVCFSQADIKMEMSSNHQTVESEQCAFRRSSGDGALYPWEEMLGSSLGDTVDGRGDDLRSPCQQISRSPGNNIHDDDEDDNNLETACTRDMTTDVKRLKCITDDQSTDVTSEADDILLKVHHAVESLKIDECSDVTKTVKESGHLHHVDDRRVILPQCQTLHDHIFNQQTMQLWIGTKGNVTPLHYDRNHGLLSQIVGRKEIILFSHEDTHNLYPHPSHSEKAHTSRVNLRCHDNSRFPKFRAAQPYVCVLEPGELLYMPPFWWHDVTSIDDCISVTLPWDIDRNDPVPAAVIT